MAFLRSTRLPLPGLALLALLLPAGSGAQVATESAAQPLLEGVEVKLVTLDVTVTGEDGAPVPGLAVEDFEVRDDDAPVEVTHFASSREPLHLIVLFDDAQLAPADRKLAMAAVRQELDRLLGAADKVLVARQAREVRTEQPFTTSREDLERALAILEQAAPGIPARTAAERALLEEIRLGDTPNPTMQGPNNTGDRMLTMTADSTASTTLVASRSLRRTAHPFSCLRSSPIRGAAGCWRRLPDASIQPCWSTKAGVCRPRCRCSPPVAPVRLCSWDGVCHGSRQWPSRSGKRAGQDCERSRCGLWSA